MTQAEDEAEADPSCQAALDELAEATPPREALIEWARDNRPPQSWFDEPDDLI